MDLFFPSNKTSPFCSSLNCSSSPDEPIMADSSSPNQRLRALIHQLRLHKPEITGFSGEDETAADDRDKVFPSIDFSDSASPSKIFPSLERFHPKKAAVLICLFEGENGELRVILTKRSSNLSSHSGEVALPGGKADEGDADDCETAMREAKEEIGLDPSLVTVAAVLEPFLSRYLLRVVPVIGFLYDIKAFKPVLNAAEVETMFDAPLDMFLKDENHRSQEREWMGEKYLLHYFDYETNKIKFLIWGLTASILIHAASVVYQQQPSFPEKKPVYKLPTYIKRNF